MTDASSKYTTTFTHLLRDIWATLAKVGSYAINAIASVSWTHLAIAAVSLAVIMTVVPLAIGLFAIFVVVKLCLNACESRRQRGAATPYKDVVSKDTEGM